MSPSVDSVMTLSYNWHNSFVRGFMSCRIILQVRVWAALRDEVIEAATFEGLTVSSWIRHVLVKAVQASKAAQQREQAKASCNGVPLL